MKKLILLALLNLLLTFLSVNCLAQTRLTVLNLQETTEDINAAFKTCNQYESSFSIDTIGFIESIDKDNDRRMFYIQDISKILLIEKGNEYAMMLSCKSDSKCIVLNNHADKQRTLSRIDFVLSKKDVATRVVKEFRELKKKVGKKPKLISYPLQSKLSYQTLNK